MITMNSDNLERMIGETISKAKKLLNCAKVEEKTLLALYEPLFRTHVFGVEGNNTVFYHDDEMYSTMRTLRTEVTGLHKEAFVKRIEDKLQRYKNIVERNKTVSRAYKTPAFSEEEAKEFAQEAFAESFWLTKNSYIVSVV